MPERTDTEKNTSSHPTRRHVLRGLGAMATLPLTRKLAAQASKTIRTYKNPLQCRAADPYVLKAPNGQYYLYSTGGGDEKDPVHAFPAYTSKNLVDWTAIGQTFIRNPADSWCIGDFWAPEVYHYRDRYYMFYSAQWRDNPNNEKEIFKIGVAVADKPEGPFKDLRNAPLFDPGYPAIDADVLFDDDGRVYLYYSRCCYKHPVESELAALAKKNGWYTEIEESWIYGVELKPDLSGVIGEPLVILRPPVTMSDPNTAWENLSVTEKEANRRWTEGPSSFKKHGKYFIMYAANSVFANNYSTGYATSTSPLGPFEKAANNPIIRKNTDHGGDVSCTGHTCWTTSPDDSELFCLFGGRAGTIDRERILMLTRMEVQRDGAIVVYPPDSTTPQPYPSGSVSS